MSNTDKMCETCEEEKMSYESRAFGERFWEHSIHECLANVLRRVKVLEEQNGRSE